MVDFRNEFSFEQLLWTALGSVTSRCPFSERNKTRGGGGTPYDGLYGKAPPERGTFFRLQVYERVGISLVEAYKRVGNRHLGLWKDPKGLTDEFYGFIR